MAAPSDRPAAPPRELVRGLLEGPAFLTGFEWHETIDSTNRRAADLAAEGHHEGFAVAADLQTAGRGRRGRAWSAPPGTSLMVSFLLRPDVAAPAWTLLPLLAGVALAEVVERYLPGVPVGLKWPNDLLVGDGKAAGILTEQHGGAIILGIGLNVDWRGVERPAELAGATSLAEAAALASGAVAGGAPAGAPQAQSAGAAQAGPAGAAQAGPVGAAQAGPGGAAQAGPAGLDRWRIFAGLVGVLGNRYADWRADPTGFLADYRARCTTLGRRVRVERPDGLVLGTAEAVADSGALVVRGEAGARVEVTAGEVTHVRAA